MPMFARSRPSRDSLDYLASLGAIGLDDEVDRQPVRERFLDRPDDGHQRPSSPNQARGPLADVAADQIEHQIDLADIFQPFVLEVDVFLCTEVERLLAVGARPVPMTCAPANLASCVTIDPDRACRSVRDDALPRSKVAVIE